MGGSRHILITYHRMASASIHTYLGDGTGPVTVLCAGPAHHVVAAHDDFTIRLWDIRTGTCVRVLAGHTDTVNAICMLPSGELLSGSDDFTLRRWSLDTGEGAALLPGIFDEKPIKSLAVLDDGNVAIGCYWENKIHVVDTAGGGILLTDFEKDSHSVGILALCALHGNNLAVGCESGVIQVWAPSRRRRIMQLPAHEEDTRVTALCTFGDRLVSAGEDDIARIWSLAARRQEHALVGHTDTVTGLCAVGSRHVATCSNDTTVRLWDVGTGNCVKVLTEHTGPVVGVCTVDGKLVSGSADGNIIVWDLQKTVRRAGMLQLSRKQTALPIDAMAMIAEFANVDPAAIYGAHQANINRGITRKKTSSPKKSSSSKGSRKSSSHKKAAGGAGAKPLSKDP